MLPAFRKFLDECRRQGIDDEAVDDLEDAADAMIAECGEHTSTIELLDAFQWILRQRSKTLLQKLDAVLRLTSLPPGPHHIKSLRRFLEW
jgi:hypothetical protein